MVDEVRKPLPFLSDEEKAKRLAAMGLDMDRDPKGLTAAEKLAAAKPGLPDPRWKEQDMETKSGFKTSEFWLSILAKSVVAAVAYFTIAGGPLDQISESLKSGGPLFLLAVPLAKTALAAFLGWCATKLASKYTDNRTELKKAALGQEG